MNFWEGSDMTVYPCHKDYCGHSMELGLDDVILEAERSAKRPIPRTSKRWLMPQIKNVTVGMGRPEEI
jgi:hypothetical protein